jgi:hypothetical protein
MFFKLRSENNIFILRGGVLLAARLRWVVGVVFLWLLALAGGAPPFPHQPFLSSSFSSGVEDADVYP